MRRGWWKEDWCNWQELVNGLHVISRDKKGRILSTDNLVPLLVTQTPNNAAVIVYL